MEKCLQSGEFQSTLPVKGATVSKVILAVDSEFQSTLPVRGATRSSSIVQPYSFDFNPRSP